MTHEILANAVECLGHAAICASTLEMGFSLARSREFDLVLLDVHLPDGNGLAALDEIRHLPSEPEVVIITGYGEPEGAAMAIKCGARDYIGKPASMAAMSLTVDRALQYREERQKAREVPIILRREGIIGHSTRLNNALERVAQAAQGDINLLVTGETGTGKELFARAIHENSRRSGKPFVVLDCAALPGTLVESLLFGHEKGAFTGADRAKDGLISQADKGTLFLDEIGELPLDLQKAFLRVLQERRYRPVGAQYEKESDFRLIAATNRDLDQMVDMYQFRMDLLFRLRSLVIELPPLRHRPEDIRELVKYYLDKLSMPFGREAKEVSDDFFDMLAGYDWPGNVRELFNTIDQAVALAGREPVLFPYHLPQEIRIKVTQTSLAPPVPGQFENFPLPKATPNLPGSLTYKNFRQQTERQYLEQLMVAAKGCRKEACRLSELSRTHLFDLLKKHNLNK
jgi:two-component system NtrC family response regulator